MSFLPGETVTESAAARVVRSVGELRATLAPARRAGQTIGLGTHERRVIKAGPAASSVLLPRR